MSEAIKQTVCYPATQEFPYPHALERIVKDIQYREGWGFSLSRVNRGQGCAGLTLSILIEADDSYNPGQKTRVMHYMPVPPAAYDERSWMRWVFDQILLVETHEAMEFFRVGGNRPYSPNHGPGRNPYSIIEKGTLKDAATFYTGEVNPKFDVEYKHVGVGG